MRLLDANSELAAVRQILYDVARLDDPWQSLHQIADALSYGRWADPDAHLYISTACRHARHGDCRKTCKFCPAACACGCHMVANA